jgi:hypothetical protein
MLEGGLQNSYICLSIEAPCSVNLSGPVRTFSITNTYTPISPFTVIYFITVLPSPCTEAAQDLPKIAPHADIPLTGIETAQDLDRADHHTILVDVTRATTVGEGDGTTEEEDSVLIGPEIVDMAGETGPETGIGKGNTRRTIGRGKEGIRELDMMIDGERR